MVKVNEISFNTNMTQNVGATKSQQSEASSIFSASQTQADAMSEMEGL